MRRSCVESGTKQPGNSKPDFVQIAAAFYHQHDSFKSSRTKRKAQIFQRWDTEKKKKKNHYFGVVLEMGRDYVSASVFRL